MTLDFKIVDAPKHKIMKLSSLRLKELAQCLLKVPRGKGIVFKFKEAREITRFRQSAHNSFKRKGLRLRIWKIWDGPDTGKHLISLSKTAVRK